MLDLGGIPLPARASAARDDPLILGGGPCATTRSRWPTSSTPSWSARAKRWCTRSADAVAAWKRSGASRSDLLWLLAEIAGVYVPSLFRVRATIRRPRARRVRAALPGYEKVDAAGDARPEPALHQRRRTPIVPFMQTVHDRLPLEMQRGCTRGCRFCQVGMITPPDAPARSQRRPPHRREGPRTRPATRRWGFLSLSAGDYSCIDGVLDDFFDEFGPENVGISLPSLAHRDDDRARSPQQIKRMRKSGFTVAPEAATERMRRRHQQGQRGGGPAARGRHHLRGGLGPGEVLLHDRAARARRDEDVARHRPLCAQALRAGQRS